jgi:hypothetical protein
LDHGVVHDFGESAHELAAGAKPVDVTERSGIVADHSVVRSRCSGAENLAFGEHGFRESVGGRRFPLVNVLLFEKVVLLVEKDVGPRSGPRLWRVRPRTGCWREAG